MTDTSSPVARPPVIRVVPQVANYINLVMIPASLLLVLLVLADTGGTFRLWLTVAVFILGPGSGITQFFKLEHASLQFGVVIGLSYAINILLSEGLLGVHNINANAAACLIAGITCIRPLMLKSKPSVLVPHRAGGAA